MHCTKAHHAKKMQVHDHMHVKFENGHYMSEKSISPYLTLQVESRVEILKVSFWKHLEGKARERPQNAHANSLTPFSWLKLM